MKKVYVEMVADLFHYGHVEFLRKARALGDRLTVGVLSDEWTKKYKKEPVMTWQERARVVESCRYVDAVLLQPEPASDEWLRENNFITAIALCNDTDRTRHLATSVGHDRAREVELPYEPGISTTAIIERITTREEAWRDAAEKTRRFFAPRWGAGEWLLAERMLQDIGALLNTSTISYFLAFGSHLGAVRHGGVIPWDDDIDIAIPEADEKRLTALIPALQAKGYNLIRYTTTSGPYTETYYKIWIRNRPSTTGRAHSWPFVDIFILRPAATSPAHCGLDHRSFPASWIFPLKQAKFGALTLPIPNNNDLLALLYDDAYMTRCFSTSYIHRDEGLAPEIISCPADVVKEAGCFVDVSARAQKLYAATPVRAEGWVLDSKTSTLTKNTSAIPMDQASLALWNDLDGRKSIEDLSGLFTGPPVEVLRLTLDALNTLLHNKAIRLKPKGAGMPNHSDAPRPSMPGTKT